MEQALPPAIAALDFAKAGAILANMIESYLAAGAPPFDLEGPDDDAIEDRRATPVAGCLHLHSPIDAGAGSLQSREHGAAIQFAEQGRAARLEPGAHSGPRPRSRPVRRADDPSRGLQSAGRRGGDEPGLRDLLLGSVAPGALIPGLAPPPLAVLHHTYSPDRRAS